MHAFGIDQARDMMTTPDEHDDKYSRGVVGFVTGSQAYPGAAVLGVSAAVFMGAGMVRYRGEDEVASLVLQRRPEVVCVSGRADAWVLGSGVDSASRSWHLTTLMRDALSSGVPCVLDAGSLDLVAEATGWAVITPHARELSRMFASTGHDVTVEQIRRDPKQWVVEAARAFNVNVLLKGSHTLIAPQGADCVIEPSAGSPWLATAGTGDVLAGAIGALLASQSARSRTSKLTSDNRSESAGQSEQSHVHDPRLLSVAAAATLHAFSSHQCQHPFTALELAEGLRDAR